MAFDGACGGDNWFDPAMGGPEVPLLQITRARLRRWLLINVLKGEADLIRTGGLEVPRGQTTESLALTSGQRLRIA